MTFANSPRLRAFFALTAAAVALAGGRAGAQQAPADQARAAIAAVIQTFVETFNKHDSAAMSVLWSDKAVHRSATTGQELVGRPAVANAYAALFKRDPKSSLALHVDSMKLEAADRALLTGVATVEHEKFAPSRSRFAARLVKVGQGWLLDRVDEADLPPDAETGLSPLAWLVGTWVDDSAAGRVVNQFHWADNRNFIVRRFWHEPPQNARSHAAPTQGMQIIGWDAEQQVIRTWFFDSHGSFGEGYWQSAGDAKWINKLAVKLPDGRRAAQTQVLQKLGDGQISLQSIDREVDGGAQPNGAAAKFVRQPDGAVQAPKVGSAAKEVVR